MVTRTQLIPHVNSHGFVMACSYCCPPLQLFALAQAYPERVSHAICPLCLVQMDTVITARHTHPR